MAQVSAKQSVDPNTVVLDIYEQHRTRVSLLLTRDQTSKLCDQLRVILGDAPFVPIPGPKLVMFPATTQLEMKIQIAHE